MEEDVFCYLSNFTMQLGGEGTKRRLKSPKFEANNGVFKLNGLLVKKEVLAYNKTMKEHAS